MTTVNIHEAKTQLSRLVDSAASGEIITIAKSGKPMAKLVRIEAVPTPRRLGFLAGQAQIPDDFDSLASNEIADDFEGSAS